MKPFADLLAEARAARGLTRLELARLTGFSASFIRSYEDNAENPTAKTMAAYARALDLRFTVTGAGVLVEDLRTESTSFIAC